MADFFFCFNSILIYSTLKRVVTSISYLPKENKLEIKQLNSKLLQETTTEVDPADLINCRRKTANPLVGYRSMINNSDRYATESLCHFHDRKLMDSIVFRTRVDRPKKSKEEVDKLWGDKSK